MHVKYYVKYNDNTMKSMQMKRYRTLRFSLPEFSKFREFLGKQHRRTAATWSLLLLLLALPASRRRLVRRARTNAH